MRARIVHTLCITLALTSANAAAQSPIERLRADIRYLADDAREGRGAGTEGLDSAAAFIARRFAEAGLEPGGISGFFQEFELDPSAPAAAHSNITAATLQNVIAVHRGRGPLGTEAVVIGAHYDHLGYGGFGSLSPDSAGVVHNGADDNASGTAALIEIGRQLVTRTAASFRTIILIAFGAEELGLLGSNHYVRHPMVENELVVAMLNLDMVGRLRDDKLIVFGTETAVEFPQLLQSANRAHEFTIAGSGDGFGRSDQSSFFAVRVPVLHFFTGTHEDYHRTTDDWQLINSQGVLRIAALVTDVAWILATREDSLTFVEATPPVRATTGGGYGAYLGTIPDMSESPGGVRFNGVRSGSPAEAAGLRAGDVLIRLGEFEIKDLYDMVDALRAHEPGDVVDLELRRAGSIIRMRATLGRRGG